MKELDRQENNIPTTDKQIKEYCLSVKDNYFYDVKHFINWLYKDDYEFNFDNFKKYSDMLLEDIRKGLTTEQTYNKRITACKKRIREIFNINAKNLDILKIYRLDQCLKEIKLISIRDKYIDESELISKEEIKKLLNSGSLNENIKLIVYFLYKTGLRVSECLNIQLGRIEEHKDEVSIKILGKGKTFHIIKIQPQFYKKIRDHFKCQTYLFCKSNGSKYTRQHITMEFRKAVKEVLNRDLSIHSLRHSFATRKLKETNNDIKAVSQALSHSSTAITMDMYIHSSLKNKNWFGDEKDIDSMIFEDEN